MGLHHAPLFLVVIFGSFLQTTQGHLKQTFTHGISAWIKLESDHPTFTVESCQQTNVLLECNCSKMTRELKWQKNDELIYSKNSTEMSYKNKTEIFRNETSKICFMLLKNLTENDTGSYKCIFNEGEQYFRKTVMLKVNSTECPDHETLESGRDPFTDRPKAYFAFIMIPAFLLFGCIFTLLRKRRRNQLHKQEVEPVGGHLFPPLIIKTPGSDGKP